MPLFDDDLHGVRVRGSRDAFVCLCVRDEMAALSDRFAIASLHVNAVLPAGRDASGLPAMSRKEEKNTHGLRRDCWNGEVVCGCMAKAVGMISA